MPSNEIIFYKKGGRPKTLTIEEAHEAKLLAKRKWRLANKERIELYNELYRNKSSGGAKHKKSHKSHKHSSHKHKSKHGSHKHGSHKHGSHKHRLHKHGSHKHGSHKHVSHKHKSHKHRAHQKN